jgi:hypothetical protein
VTCHKGKDNADPMRKHKAMKAVAYGDVVIGKLVISFTLWTLYTRVKKQAVAPIPYRVWMGHTNLVKTACEFYIWTSVIVR